jgi:uncharacterized membrane protein
MNEEQQETSEKQEETTSPDRENETLGQESSDRNIQVIAAMSYVIFFLPFLVENKKNSFTLYHANQGLLVLLTALGVNMIGSLIPIFGWFIILPLGNIFVFILVLMGIFTALKGEKKELPFIGGFSLLSEK